MKNPRNVANSPVNYLISTSDSAAVAANLRARPDGGRSVILGGAVESLPALMPPGRGRVSEGGRLRIDPVLSASHGLAAYRLAYPWPSSHVSMSATRSSSVGLASSMICAAASMNDRPSPIKAAIRMAACSPKPSSFISSMGLVVSRGYLLYRGPWSRNVRKWRLIASVLRKSNAIAVVPRSIRLSFLGFIVNRRLAGLPTFAASRMATTVSIRRLAAERGRTGCTTGGVGLGGS